MKKLVWVSGLVLLASGCAKQPSSAPSDLGKNLVVAGNSSVNRTVTDNGQTFRVLAKGALQTQAARLQIALPGSAEGNQLLEKNTDSVGAFSAPAAASPAPIANDPTSLVVGIPLELLGEQYVFDGVITQVSNTTDASLGNLKLTDLTAAHVKMSLVKEASGGYHVGLFGCLDKCTESSKLEDLQDLPVVGVDTDKKLVLLDLAALGKDLDLMSVLDPDGSALHLKTVSTKTVAFDYSLSTLVFDIESHMVAAPDKDAAATTPVDTKETVFTTRWFLRLSSDFNPAFTIRTPTDGVGFFLTQRGATPHITRWSTSSPDGVAPVHYYLKNIPQEHQAAFQSAFDEWNDKLKPIVGKAIFSYEFVAAGDPKNALLVPGDPRFNIVEWDLVNLATYGGLGPSIANQFTGENISANVYIQGPTIIGLYKDWFKVNKLAQDLRDQGQAQQADAMLEETRHELVDRLNGLEKSRKFNLSMHGLAFRIHAQLPELSDPAAQRNDFDPLPAGLTYEQFMFGYFHDMLTHELGHNLGLRHNFKGNLGSIGDGPAEVSRSVMEYLGRDYRYQDHVGEYDLMALSYGYQGKTPDHLDWFCTDENGVESDAINNSAECTSNDATGDPFAWYQMRLDRAIGLLVARGDTNAPTWTTSEMDRELGIAVNGLGFYASSAAKTASTWIKFFTGGERPKDGSGVKAYVLEKLKAQVCAPALDKEATLKSTAEANAKTADNIKALRTKVAQLISAQKTITADELNCN